MKKFLISLCIFFILLIILDFIGYRLSIRSQLQFIDPKDRATMKFPSFFENRFRMYDDTTIKGFEKYYSFREPSGVEEYKNAKPIWLFGCSFAYGVNKQGDTPLEDSFGYILSKYTKRPVYNRAFPSWGVQHMYYQLEKGKIFDELPEPEYVIYVYIADHFRRTQKIVYDVWSDGEYLRYKIKDGKLEKINGVLIPLWKFYPVKLWLTHLEYYIRLKPENNDKNFDIIEKLFIESKKLIQQRYPNTKFIILKYDGNDGFDRWSLNTPRWKELSDDGFIVIDADKLINKSLTSPEYLSNDNYHPSAKAWVDISKKLNKIL